MNVTKKTRFLKRHRGITEVISTLLLMSITVAGSAVLAYFMNDAFVSGAVSSISSSDVSAKSVHLLAYDTRDSVKLLQMTALDNHNVSPSNGVLCGITCKDNTNRIPENFGTEFIVFRIKNNSIDPIFLGNVIINNVPHLWDSNTRDIQLDANSDDTSGLGKYPSDGMFSVIPSDSSSLHQRKNEIKSGGTADIIVKLGPDDADIPLNNGIRILLDIGVVQFAEFIIESGDAR